MKVKPIEYLRASFDETIGTESATKERERSSSWKISENQSNEVLIWGMKTLGNSPSQLIDLLARMEKDCFRIECGIDVVAYRCFSNRLWISRSRKQLDCALKMMEMIIDREDEYSYRVLCSLFAFELCGPVSSSSSSSSSSVRRENEWRFELKSFAGVNRDETVGGETSCVALGLLDDDSARRTKIKSICSMNNSLKRYLESIWRSVE